MSAEVFQLQVNDAGAWKNVGKVAEDQIDEVILATSTLAATLGRRPTWRIANRMGKVVADDEAIRSGHGRLATCVECGCTDDRACPGGCHWVNVDRSAGTGLCSACA